MDYYITESELISFFSGTGANYMKQHCSPGYFSMQNNQQLYYELYTAEHAAGVIVICHGFTESCAKYREMIYYCLQNHFHVLTYDQRGHGRSFREIKNPCKVHIKNFKSYIEDLHQLVTAIIQPSFPELPLFLFGHSMGGCIASRYLETHPDTFERAVLSSPMLGIKTGRLPLPAALLIAGFMKLAGQGTAYVIGHGDFIPEANFENSHSTSEVRYRLYHDLRLATPAFQTSGADYDWLLAALSASKSAIRPSNVIKIRIPVLLFESEQDSCVTKKSLARFRKYAPIITYHAMPDTKHEILNSKDSVLQKYYNLFFRFLGR